MRLIGHGHEAIRATHAKTLEFTAAAHITERATCVVAVGVVPVAGGGGWQPMAGPVRITITAAGHRLSVDAYANSGWRPGGSAVVRRGPLRVPGTFALDADCAAGGLPREFAAALRLPSTTVEVEIAPRAGAPTVVLCAVDVATPDLARLTAELAAADRVLAGDPAARTLLAGADGRDADGREAGTGRTLVVATQGLPSGPALAGARVETPGLAPPLAAAAAASVLLAASGPVLVVDGDPRDLLRRAPAGTRLVLSTTRRELPAILAQAQAVRGATDAVVAQPLADPVRVLTNAPPDFPGADRLACCVTGAAEALDPAVDEAIGVLLADGVATRTTARVLAALTGWPQRRAYDAVLEKRAADTR